VFGFGIDEKSKMNRTIEAISAYSPAKRHIANRVEHPKASGPDET
jgi:hypothetical protein